MADVEITNLYDALLGNDSNVYLSDNTELSTEEIYHKYYGRFVGIEITKTWQDGSCRSGIVRCCTSGSLPDGLFMKYVMDNRLFCTNADALKPVNSEDRHWVLFKEDNTEVLSIGEILRRHVYNFVIVDVKSKSEDGSVESGIVKCISPVAPSDKFRALLSENKNYKCLALGVFNPDTEEWSLSKDMFFQVDDNKFLSIQEIIRYYRNKFVWVENARVNEKGRFITGGVVKCYSDVLPDSGTRYRCREMGYKLINASSYEEIINMVIFCKDNTECMPLEDIVKEYAHLNIIVEPVSLKDNGDLETAILKAYCTREPREDFLDYLYSDESLVHINTSDYNIVNRR